MLNIDPKFNMLIEQQLIRSAFYFAAGAHSAINQVRKYTGEPYIVHPIEVCMIVSTVTTNPQLLAAALLHDVVEDTNVSIREIETLFGFPVCNLVNHLTDVSKPTDGNRAARKRLDRLHTWEASYDAQTIKLADLIANSLDIEKHDKNFAKVYMAEKASLLSGMSGNPVLKRQAKQIVDDYHSSLL